MKPPTIRPSSLPALAKCPCYSPDQAVGEEQKSDGTKRHTALGLYLADDPGWRSELGEWDSDGVEWAGEYIRTHAPMSSYPLEIEERSRALLPNFVEIPGTPDVFCGPVLFDLKGRDIDSYREQMDAYVLMRGFPTVTVHVLYATERRASTFTVDRAEAEARVMAIVEAVEDPQRKPRVCDFCGWCANRAQCPAFAVTGKTAANNLGLPVPVGVIEEIRDAAGLGQLKRAADAVAEWAEEAKRHCRDMAVKEGVVAEGFQLLQRRGNPTIDNVWLAIQKAGLTPEQVAEYFSVSLPDLTRAFATAHGLKEKAARADLEQRLGELIKRGANVNYLKSI